MYKTNLKCSMWSWCHPSSRNHKIPECQGLKGPGKLIQCNPPMEQEHPDEVTQEGVQAGWNVCTEGDSTTPWAAWARLCHPHQEQVSSQI